MAGKNSNKAIAARIARENAQGVLAAGSNIRTARAFVKPGSGQRRT